MYTMNHPRIRNLRVSLNKTLEFPFWDLEDFDLRDSTKMQNMKKLNKIIFQNKNIDIETLINKGGKELQVIHTPKC